MKRFFIAFAGCLAMAFTASAVNVAPTVMCEMMYTKNDARTGETLDSASTVVQPTVAGAQASLKGFALKTRLMEIRAAGSRPMPVVGYSLMASVAKGDANSLMMINITTGNQRYSTALMMGNETAFVNCDMR